MRLTIYNVQHSDFGVYKCVGELCLRFALFSLRQSPCCAILYAWHSFNQEENLLFLQHFFITSIISSFSLSNENSSRIFNRFKQSLFHVFFSRSQQKIHETKPSPRFDFMVSVYRDDEKTFFFLKKCLTRKVYNFDGWSNFTRKFI